MSTRFAPYPVPSTQYPVSRRTGRFAPYPVPSTQYPGAGEGGASGSSPVEAIGLGLLSIGRYPGTGYRVPGTKSPGTGYRVPGTKRGSK
jgi:hypothetical protein